MVMVFPTFGMAGSPSTGLRPATVVGKKTSPIPPRPRHRDANGGTQSAEYPTVEGVGSPVEAPSVSGWEDPIDRAVSVVMHVLGHNWTDQRTGQSVASSSLARGNWISISVPRGSASATLIDPSERSTIQYTNHSPNPLP